MMRAHQPGSQPLDIPEAIPNPAVPQPAPAPSPAPREPVKVPAPQGAVATRLRGLVLPFPLRPETGRAARRPAYRRSRSASACINRGVLSG